MENLGGYQHVVLVAMVKDGRRGYGGLSAYELLRGTFALKHRTSSTWAELITKMHHKCRCQVI